jgi:3-dehydroquinate dehydratase-1
MEPSQFAFRTADKEIIVGPTPLVVGTLSSLSSNLAARKYQGACDIVEVRLDRAPAAEDWRERCQRIESLGWPVLLTLRLRGEGGNWTGSDSSRQPAFVWALQWLSAIDVELGSRLAAPLAKLAKKLGKICIVSYHDFDKTPPLRGLEAIVSKAQRLDSIVKISTKICDESDLNTLRSLLAKKWKRPLCVIGMGADWKDSRVLLAREGSCLTYGYLDKPAAPGQIPARQLMKKLGKGVGSRVRH